MMKIIRREFVILFVLLLQGCATRGEYAPPADLSSPLKDNELIIVGTIELIPPLRDDEQVLDYSTVWDIANYEEKNKNRALLYLNSKPEQDWSKYILNPRLGKPFFFKVPRNMQYVVDAYINMRWNHHDPLLLPVGIKLDIQPDDNAIYIGKITYYRDDFNSVEKIKLTDEYEKVNAIFRKKYGEKYQLRKVKMEPIDTSE